MLFIELEDSPTVIAKRLEFITEGFSATQQQLLQENFRIWTPGAGLDPRFTSLATAIYKRLLDLGVKEAGGGVVVIDTLLAVSEGDENAAGAHRELWAIATWLAQELNVVVVFRDLRLKGWVDPDHNRLTPAGHLALNTASTASISTPHPRPPGQA